VYDDLIKSRRLNRRRAGQPVDADTVEFALLQARVAFLMDRLRLSAFAGQLDDATLQYSERHLADSRQPLTKRQDFRVEY